MQLGKILMLPLLQLSLVSMLVYVQEKLIIRTFVHQYVFNDS